MRSFFIVMFLTVLAGCEIVIDVPDFPDSGNETILINMCPKIFTDFDQDAGCVASICIETCKRVTLFCGVNDAGYQCDEYCDNYTIADVECLLDGSSCIELVGCFGN